ncbi:MAG: hypothetical protein JNJ71_00785 [Rubrivivax sp.]|nr:hypothetical protein [Rubrivivax sp.]
MLNKTSLSLALAVAALASGTALANQPAKPAAAASPKPTAATPSGATAAAPARPAAQAPARPAARPATTAGTARPAAAAAAAAPVVALTAGQMDAAQRVFVGKADCEFGEKIDVTAVDGRPGHFQLKHKAATYNLVPEETTTGAVRLEDKRAGIVWLQIPSKSMLMNAKIGQRVADNCQMTQQKS